MGDGVTLTIGLPACSFALRTEKFNKDYPEVPIQVSSKGSNYLLLIKCYFCSSEQGNRVGPWTCSLEPH